MRQLYAHMTQALLRHPALLQSHRDDFEVHDYNELASWGAPGARYLWLARPHGSDIALLDVHPRVTERCRAILLSTGDPTGLKAFLVTEGGTNEVDHATASQLLGAGRFAINGSRITCDGNAVATFRVIQSLGWGRQPSASVLFASHRVLTSFDVAALRQLAQALVTEELDLFAKIDAIKLDGRDLAAERIEALRRENVRN